MADVEIAAQTDEEDKQRSLLIPVKNSDQAVEVFADELPEDVNDIIDILRAEVAPLDVWLKFAVEYYNQGQVSQFQEILSVASEPGIEEIYKDEHSRTCRIKFFNALASHAVNAMWHEEDEKKREAISQRAVSYFQRADRLDHQHPMTLVGKALMFMAKGEDDRADRFLKSVLISHPNHLPAVLGKAVLLYRKKKYGEAKKLFLEAIKLHPKSPQASRMRMAFAYCCFHEGAVDKARQVMKYAASLDDTNVDAVLATALWQLASQGKDERQMSVEDETSRFMTLLHHAHAIDSTNPTVLNHLANHYFAQWVPLPCTVSASRGSKVLLTSKDVSSELSPGEMVRVGDRYIAYISSHDGAVTSSAIELDADYREETLMTATIYRKDYTKMLNLAGNAFHATQVPEIRAESCYLMGRGCHAQGRYKDAYSYYFNAGRLWPDFVLPWYGLAQMYIHRKEFGKATNYLEKADKAHPDNVDVLLLLGHAYGQVGKKEDAVRLLRRVVELDPGNLDALLNTAELLRTSSERKDQIVAVSSYVAAEKVLQTAGEHVPMELYVNLGVLQERVGKLEDAMKSFHHALELDGGSTEEETKESEGILVVEDLPTPTESNVTVLYNMGVLLEHMGERETARRVYEFILQTFPTYLDALLRIGCMERDAGAYQASLSTFDKALEVDNTCASACFLQGNIHMGKKEWSLAQKKFEKAMGMPEMKNDPYAFLSMGNIFMRNLGEKNRYTKNLSLAEVYYKKTLQTQPKNLYAANGLGIMIAEKGNFEKAKQVFTHVREASPDVPDAWINLAHVLMAEERYGEAIQLYSVCLSKGYNGQDVEVVLYLAKAYYEAKNYPKCITTLTKAIHLDPTDMRLWYNLGLAQEDFAVTTLGQGSSGSGASAIQRTLADVERAIADLQRARRIFQYLVDEAEKSATGLPYEKDKVEEHVKFIGETLEKASVHLEFEKQKEERRRVETEQQRQMLKEYEEKVAREKEEERQKEEDLRKRREDVLIKQEERLKQMSQGWKQKEEEEKKATTGKKKGGKKRKKEEDDFIDDGEENEDGEDNFSIEDMKNRNAKMKGLVEKRQKRAAKDESNLFGSDSSDGEEEKQEESQPTESQTQEDDLDDGKKQDEANELFGSSSDSE